MRAPQIRYTQVVVVEVVVLEPSHVLGDADVEEHAVKSQRVVRVRFCEDQMLILRAVLVARDPAELVAVGIVGTPERDVQQPGMCPKGLSAWQLSSRLSEGNTQTTSHMGRQAGCLRTRARIWVKGVHALDTGGLGVQNAGNPGERPAWFYQGVSSAIDSAFSPEGKLAFGRLQFLTQAE